MRKSTVNSSNNQQADLASTPGRQERLGATLRAHSGALAIGALFLLLSILYNVTIPAWEADNELSHFNYVRYLIDQRALPASAAQVAAPVITDICRSGEERILLEQTHQFRQPPLYYLLGALTTFWVDTDSTGPAAANPFRMWDPKQLGYNFALHDPANEGLPYHNTLLALHLLRLLSGVLGLIGLAATYLLGLLLFDGRRSLATAMMAVNAFIPQYLFASAIVNNDILVAALSAWCLLLCAYVALRDQRLRTLFLAALLAGLAIMAKYNGVVLLFPLAVAATAVLAAAWRASRRQFASALLQIVLVAGLVGIPGLVWLARSDVLSVQLLGTYRNATTEYVDHLWVGLSEQAASGVWHATRYAFVTFWGQFGWDTLTLPAWVIGVFAVISAAAALGIVLMLADQRQPRRWRLILLMAGLFLLLTLLQAYAKAAGSWEPRGRYLFPALAIIAFLLIAGLQRVLPPRYELAGVRAFGLGLLALALAVPFTVLAPAYALPRLEASADLLPGEQPLHAVIGGFAELIGYRVEPQRVAVGDPVQVTLVWRALGETPNNYTLSIHLLDGDKYPRAWVMSHPGRGNFPTSIWQPGDIFRESYTLYWADTPWERLPSLATLKVALFCPGSATVQEASLEVTDAQGAFLGDALYFGRLKALTDTPPASVAPLTSLGYTFDETLALDAITLTPGRLVSGQEVTMELRWRVLRQPAADYTLFAHVIDAGGQQIGGNDQPLTDGYYPSGLWEPGEVITHVQRLSLPPLLPSSTVEIRVGLYEPVSGQRLPLHDNANLRVRDDSVVAAVIDTPEHRVFMPVVDIHLGHDQ